MTDSDDPYRTIHDWRSDPLAASVVSAVEDGSGLGTSDFDLDDYVNPDALNALFRPRPAGSLRDEGTVQFVVEGNRVVVHATGKILVHPETGED